MARINKVLLMDGSGEKVGESASQQVQEDPFGDYARGLVKPPFPLEQLNYLAEMHPVHGSALEQKSTDIIGVGWEWEPVEGMKDEAGEDMTADEEQRNELEDWFTGLAGDESTMAELLYAVQVDFETTGQGYLEVARMPGPEGAGGEVGQVYHAPAQTIRWHKSGMALAQERASKFVWFRRWGVTEDEFGNALPMIAASSGYRTDDASKAANELLVFRKTSRRSSWYGIPTYVAAIGWVTLAIAARDYNILFFQNAREARWAVVLENIDDDPELLNDIEQAFKVGLKDPHRNIIIPIVGEGGKVTFQKLSQDGVDMSFDKLMGHCNDEILVAHRMPGDRVGLSKTGPLGGSAAGVTNEVYVEGVVTPGQELMASRIRRFIEVEFARHKGLDPDTAPPLQWQWTPSPVDLSEETDDLNAAVQGFQKGGWTLNEARAKVGRDPLPDDDPRGDMFVWELTPKPSGAGLVGDPNDPNSDPSGNGGLFGASAPLLEDETERRLREHEERLLATLDLFKD